VRRPLTGYVVVVVALLLSLLLLVLGTGPPSQNDDPSSRVAGRAGTLALYRWLGGLGFAVHRISGGFDTTASDVLFIVDPRTSISASDASSVMGALAGGSDVVLAVSPQSRLPATRLLDRLRLHLHGTRAAGDSVPAQPFDAANRVHRVPMAGAEAIATGADLTPLLTQSGAVTAVAERIGGAGRAYVLASTFPLSNDGLRRGDSAGLVLSLLERARGGRIGFDEYHHGEIDVAASGAAAIFESPLGLSLLLAVAAVVAFLALGGRRLGRPLPGHDPAVVPSTGSYIEAMAGLYARAGDRGAVATRYAEELKLRLTGAGAGPGEPRDDAFLAFVGSARPELAGEVAAVLARARALSLGRPRPSALLALARDVDGLERRWTQRRP